MTQNPTPNYQGRFFGYSVDVDRTVFLISAGVVLSFVVFTIAFQAEAQATFTGLKTLLTEQLGWLFLVAANIVLITAICIALSPLGRVRLGGIGARAAYSYTAWFSMLFAAGMGIGLVFYGVAEPLAHFQSAMAGPSLSDGVRTDYAPLGGALQDADDARRLGMAATIFHWALHPWAIYAMMALGFALTSYNNGLPLTVRSIFYPILGDRIWGWPGQLIDILAIFATLFGLATSLGLGASQTASGIQYVFGLTNSITLQLILIAFITLLATLSVVSGLDRGVKRLSELNLGLATLLFLFVLLAGPTYVLVDVVFESLTSYVGHLPALASPMGREDRAFSVEWTAFYLAWWVSWSPFVGMFIARVSIGRTVREFIACVLIIPSIGCILWMSVFGGSAIVLNELTGDIARAELPLKLFVMLNQLPLAELTSIIAMLLAVIFFVTSSDSGSMVIDGIASGGVANTPITQRIFWCTLGGSVAAALVLGGGLVALQAMAISTGLPFAIILLIGTAATVNSLRQECLKLHE